MKRDKKKKNKIYNKIEWKTDIRVYVGYEKNQARKHLLTNARHVGRNVRFVSYFFALSFGIFGY